MISPSEIAAAVCLLIGSAFIVSAVLGVLRFPDVFSRMHAVTKAGTLGVAFFMIATAIIFGEPAVMTRAVGVVLFVLLTAPVGAQMIGRAAYFSKARVSDSTVVDEVGERYGITPRDTTAEGQQEKTQR